MQVTINAKNLEVSDTLRHYIESRVGKLDRYLSTIQEARVDISVQRARDFDDRHTVQLTLRSNGAILRAEDRSGDIRTAVDAVLDKITRQIERYKGKRWRSQNQRQGQAELIEGAEPELASTHDLVRVKRFATRPMDVDEAIEQMELLGHDFFLFYDIEQNSHCVVYRRRDGGYGLLIPEPV